MKEKEYTVIVTVSAQYTVTVKTDDPDEIEEQACLELCESDLNNCDRLDVIGYDIMDKSGKTVRIS